VTLHRARLERACEIGVAAVGAVIAAHALGDVLRQLLDSEPAGLFSFLPTADAVGDHHQCSQPFLRYRKLGEIGKARLHDIEPLPQRADDEVVLVGWTDQAWVGQTV